MGSTIVLPNKKQQSGKLFRCQVVNIFSVTGGKLIDCHEFRFGKKIRRHGGKLSKCPVVKKFIDFHRAVWCYFTIPPQKVIILDTSGQRSRIMRTRFL